MNTLTINCSSDRLQIWIKEQYYELSNKGLEMSFPAQLIQWINQHSIKDIYVINGPGSFTTLRVVCLTLNLYASMHPGVLRLRHCTKTDLYNDLLPRVDITQIAIYIGQRNNMWLYTITDNSYVMMSKSDIDDSIAFDDVSAEYAGDHHTIGISLDLLPNIMKQVDILHPHYLMEPNVG